MKNNLLYNTEMKKLYYLDESEKERILNLHQVQKIKRIWMNEQTATTPVQANVPKGTLTDIETRDLQSILSNNTGGDWGYTRPMINNLHNFCINVASPNRITLPIDEILLYAKEIDRARAGGGMRGAAARGGRGLTDEAKVILSSRITALKNIPNFCYAVINGDTSESGEARIVDNFDEIFRANLFAKYVINPIQGLRNASNPSQSSATTKVKPEKWPQEYACIISYNVTYDTTYNLYKDSKYYYYSDGTMGSVADPDKEIGNFRCSKSGKIIIDLNVDEDKVKEAGFDKFPCVTSNEDKKVFYTSSNQITFIIGDYLYYGSGRRYNQKTKQMSDYHCGSDNMIKDGLKPATTTSTETNTTSGLTGPWGKALGTAPKLLNTSTVNQTVINNMVKNLGIV
jgi:hypothetical protein